MKKNHVRLVVGFDRHKLRKHLHDQSGYGGGEGILSARFAVGIAIIALGALFLFDSLDLIEARYVLRRAWPLIFVVIGIAILSKPRHGRRRNEGWVFIAVGVWLFLSKIGLFNFSFWGVLFPLLLVFVGGVLVYRSLSPPRIQVTFDPADAPPPGLGEGPGEMSPGMTHSAFASREPGTASSTIYARADEEHAEYIRTFSMLSGSELRPMSRPFRGADLSAVLGGVTLDLTSARMDGDSARVEVFAFCGGIDIRVPPDWTVTSKVATLLGGFSDKRRPTTTLPTKTLIIDGFAVMGGIEVKN
jgi:predicted membrane protein